MATCLLAVAFAAPLLHLMHSRDRRYRRHEAARLLRRSQREQQWRAMIREEDEVGRR